MTFRTTYYRILVVLGVNFIFIFTGLFPDNLAGQQKRHTSLMGWEHQKQLLILDRYHNYGGVFYDRGLFRFTTPSMIEHHDLDLITYGFSSHDDYHWYMDPDNSFRAFGGSFNIGEFLHGAELRNYIPLSENLTLPLKILRRYDMRQDRAMAFLGLTYRFHEDHSIGIRHTLTEQKPDLDITFHYSFGDLQTGGLQFELTALDWANNAAYDLGQRRGDQPPEMKRYETQPYLFSVRAASPTIQNFRGEWVAGIQTPQRFVAESMPEKYENQSFRDRTIARYTGMLVEYASPYFTAAFSWMHSYTRFSRTNTDESPAEPVNYGNFQNRHNLGLFLSVNYRSFYSENRIWYQRNRDRQFDHVRSENLSGVQVYPFNFRENRWMMQYRIGYDPASRGWKTALEFSSDYRKPLSGIIERADGSIARGLPYHLQYPHSLDERNERLTLYIGYRFTRQIFILFGASADLDREVIVEEADSQRIIRPGIFDGGFGRLVLYW